MKREAKEVIRVWYERIIITIIVLGAVACGVLFIFFGNHRTIDAKVVEKVNGLITFEDSTNNLWLYESDDYKIDEKVILTFNDRGTDFLTDDEIIKVEVLK